MKDQLNLVRAFIRALTLAPLQDLQLSLVLEADTGTDVVEEWWFWTVAGVGAVGLVVGAVFLGIALTPPSLDCGVLAECATATLP